MIIWGSYVMRKKLGTGDFYCPGCQDYRKYTKRKPRRWGHLYWIPLIPMEEHETYVECDSCKKAWREAVLDQDPVREQRQLEDGVTTMIAQAVGLMARSRGQQARPSTSPQSSNRWSASKLRRKRCDRPPRSMIVRPCCAASPSAPAS